MLKHMRSAWLFVAVAAVFRRLCVETIDDNDTPPRPPSRLQAAVC